MSSPSPPATADQHSLDVLRSLLVLMRPREGAEVDKYYRRRNALDLLCGRWFEVVETYPEEGRFGHIFWFQECTDAGRADPAIHMMRRRERLVRCLEAQELDLDVLVAEAEARLNA
jgi:hypothetical protein